MAHIASLGGGCRAMCSGGRGARRVHRVRSNVVRAHGGGSGWDPESATEKKTKARTEASSKPRSIEELLQSEDSDADLWATREELPDLSQPARNVSQWLGPETREKPKRVRPWWAWWPLDLNEMDDSVNMGLVSPGGSTVSRLTTQEEWERHRNPWRYWRSLVALFQGRSTVLRRSAVNLTILTTMSLAICAWNTQYPSMVLQLNPLPFSILGAFVSLLLVFRTNASYGRFCEARLLLGQLVLHTREFARLAVIHFPSYALRHKAMAYVSAFAWCLKARVRLGDRPEVYVSELLGPRETSILLRKSKPAFFALQELTKMVASCEEQLPDYVSIGLNTQLEHMDRVLGGCERIISTPIPLSYTRHTTRSLLLYLLGLPLAIWPLMGWGTPLVTLVFAFVAMGIEETGNHIEEPFCIMPIQQLCQVVTATCRETLDNYGRTKISSPGDDDEKNGNGADKAVVQKTAPGEVVYDIYE